MPDYTRKVSVEAIHQVTGEAIHKEDWFRGYR